MRIVKEGKHFAFMWYWMIAFAVTAALPFDVSWFPLIGGHPGYHMFAIKMAMLAFGVFWGAELSAPDIKDGEAGTFTNFTFFHFPALWQREILGFGLPLLMIWRVDFWVGALFLNWLPLHYVRPGNVGYVDWVTIKIGKFLMKSFHLHFSTV